MMLVVRKKKVCEHLPVRVVQMQSSCCVSTIGWAATVLGASLPGLAAAQGATNVVSVQLDKTPHAVSVGDYYSQVLFEVGDFDLPIDDNGRKQLGSALLAAFGLGDKTRSLTITATLSQKGQVLPGMPLITYEFNGKKRLTNFKRASSYLSPRWQLGASDPIAVSLQYRYSEAVVYNPEEITKQVQELIPSAAIVSTLGKPFVASIASLTSSIFENSGSRAVNVTVSDDLLLPYAGPVGSRAITYTVKVPNGRPLGTIKATLLVTPSLVRPLTKVDQAKTTDLERGNDDVTALALDVAGSRRLLLTEIKGVPLYAALVRDQTPKAVRDYCAQALPALSNYDLTRLDRTTLVYQSLVDAGFRPGVYHPTANGWLADCFTTQADMSALKVAVKIDFMPPTKPGDAGDWPLALKVAMGCWITNQSGSYCRQNAPDPRTILSPGMADEIDIGVTELPFFSADALPPGRRLPKTDLLTFLNGSAESFSCYAKGLVIAKAGQSYVLGVTVRDDQIRSLQVLRASSQEASCLG